MTTADPSTTGHTPAWAVVVMGMLLLPLAGLGFALSFQMMLPVMVIAGWSVAIAWGGPVLVDLAAASGALMQMVSRDTTTRRWGTGVLGFSTLLSIAMNLAGHSVKRPRGDLPGQFAGMTLPGGWQWVVMLMSIATPLFIAVLVHAFGHVLMAYLATRPTAVADPTRLPTARPADPTGHPTRLPTRPAVATRPDPTPVVATRPTEVAGRPDPTRRPASDPTVSDPTRLGPDSGADLQEPVGSDSRSDLTGQPATHPTPDPTDPRVGHPTGTRPTAPDRPDSPPTRPADPTPDSTAARPDPTDSPDQESGADPTDPELTRLVARARELIESGAIRPTADAIRPALGVGSARAREIRDALKNDQRHGLRAVS